MSFEHLFVPIAPIVGVVSAPKNVLNFDDRSKDPINTIVPPIVTPIFGTESLKELKKENDGKLYFPPPPVILTRHKYQSVNNDTKLQNMVTQEFYQMLKIWLNEDEFKPLLKIKTELMNKNDGPEIVLRLLKLYVKKNNTNFYDLENQTYQVKDFILYKLTQLI